MTSKTNKEIFRQAKNKCDELVLSATDMAVFLVPYPFDYSSLVDTTTGDLNELPAGTLYLGEIQKSAGMDITPDLKTDGPEGYGSAGKRRVFITDESTDVDFTVQEIRKGSIAVAMGLDEEDIYTSEGNQVTKLTKRRTKNITYWCLVAIAKDHARLGDIYPIWVFPKVAVTKRGKMSLSESKEMSIPLTFSVYEADDVLYELQFAGPGWPELAVKAGFGLAATKTVTIPGNVTGGTFTLTFDDKNTTAPIEFDATPEAAQTIVRKLRGYSKITVTGAAKTLIISGIDGTLSVDSTGLTGGTATVA